MICVDASVAMKWVVEEEHSDRAEALVRDAQAVDEPMLAPPVFRYEVTNSIRRQVVQSRMSMDEARERVAAFLAYPVTLFGPDLLHVRALEIADQHGLPATYDAHYVALAELLVCDLWTADERLVRGLGAHFRFVRWIGAYPTA